MIAASRRLDTFLCNMAFAVWGSKTLSADDHPSTNQAGRTCLYGKPPIVHSHWKEHPNGRRSVRLGLAEICGPQICEVLSPRRSPWDLTWVFQPQVPPGQDPLNPCLLDSPPRKSSCLKDSFYKGSLAWVQAEGTFRTNFLMLKTDRRLDRSHGEGSLFTRGVAPNLTG